MSVKNGGTLQRLLVLLAALALQLCAATMVAAQTVLPEGIPDFSQDATRTRIQTVASGNWSSPSTWQGGVVPTSNTVVRILQAHTVTITDQNAAAYTVSVDGKLAFAPTANTRLTVTNLQVMAGDMGMGTPGVLEVGTTANPIPAGMTAEIVVANNPLGGSVADPDQFGTGITVLGKVSMHGSVRTPTFVRLATEPRAGQSTLTLSAPAAGWQVGDRLILPDTRHMKTTEVDSGIGGRGWVNKINQWEELTVQAISPDGRTVTLALPLVYDHLGARDLNNVLEFLPHVGNLTRNVVIRSESATGTRGHVMATHMADVDIRYALFKDLGRTTYLPLNATTNHIGRYPIHMHHLSGPTVTPANGYQFTLLGNAVDGSSIETKFKWGITVHGSHYGSIKDNVVYNYNGAAIATEDGSESFNEFDHNFVMRGIGEPDEPGVQARMAMGTEGVGFWFRGPNNFVRNNVAANFQNPTTEAALRLRLSVQQSGHRTGPDSTLQGRGYPGHARPGAGDLDERQQHAAPRVRQQRSVRRDAGSLDLLVGQLAGSATIPKRSGKRHQEFQGLAHLQQDRLRVSRAEGDDRRLEDPRQVRRVEPMLRRRRLVRGLLDQGHDHPERRHPGHGGRHPGALVRLRARAEPAGRELLPAQLAQHQRPDAVVRQRLLDGRQARHHQQHPVRCAAGTHDLQHQHGWKGERRRVSREAQ